MLVKSVNMPRCPHIYTGTLPCFRELKFWCARSTLTSAVGRALKWEYFAWAWPLHKEEVITFIVLGQKAACGCWCLLVRVGITLQLQPTWRKLLAGCVLAWWGNMLSAPPWKKSTCAQQMTKNTAPGQGKQVNWVVTGGLMALPPRPSLCQFIAPKRWA